MSVYHDQLNRIIELPHLPQRIISTVPSQTELLFDLGLDEKIVGITGFCTHPAGKVKTVTKIGGTKKLDIPLIKSLNPDLVIANKEENDRQQVEALMAVCPVWISDINDLNGAIGMITGIGDMLNCQAAAKMLSSAILKRFNQLTLPVLSLRVAYLIWRKPYMVAGTDTFINSMLQTCGLRNAFDLPRYPEVNIDSLIEARPDVVLLSSEPYPFGQKHVEEFRAILPNARIILVDGEMFLWYGSRLLYAPAYFEALISKIPSA